MNLEILQEALDEAEGARDYYAESDLAIGQRFLEELDWVVERILEAPLAFPSYLHGTRKALFRGFPYVVVFRPCSKGIVILAVAHQRRRPGYWEQRL